ncbi:MAG TPA: DUF1579 family protein [Gemmataceae bacterium]|nr:DUF1579 family protein [Gemmataceae bacterium]
MLLPKLRVLVLLVASGWLAPAVPAQAPKDPQAAYEPRSAPGAGQKFLEKFAGDWDVAKTFYPRSGEPVRVKGECRQTMINGGRFLRSEFVFGEGAARTTGLGLIGFEADSGKFTSVWVDSRSTRMSLRQSADKFNGEEIRLVSRSLDEGGGRRHSRTVTRLEDGGRKIVHRQYAVGADGKERLMMELVLTRKAKPLPVAK